MKLFVAMSHGWAMPHLCRSGRVPQDALWVLPVPEDIASAYERGHLKAQEVKTLTRVRTYWAGPPKVHAHRPEDTGSLRPVTQEELDSFMELL